MKTEKEIVRTVLTFGGHDLRIIDRQGGQWFPAKDVCDGLGLANVSRAIESLEVKEKASITLSNARGHQREQRIISEQGAWRLALKSVKPEAKRFQVWLLYEVLPSIQKTGAYSAPDVLPPLTPVTDLAVKRMELHIATAARLGAKEERIAQDNKARSDRADRRMRARALKRAAKLARGTGRVDEDTLIAYELKAEEVLAGESLGALRPTPVARIGFLSVGEMADRCRCSFQQVMEVIAYFEFRSDSKDGFAHETYAPEKVAAVEARLLHRQVGKCGVQLLPKE